MQLSKAVKGKGKNKSAILSRKKTHPKMDQENAQIDFENLFKKRPGIIEM